MNLKLTDISTAALPEIEDFAVVLCGGGAAGRWQAGVLAALVQTGVFKQAKLIAGTSVGGLNTGLFSIYGTTAPKDNTTTPLWYSAVEVWEAITKNSDVYTGSINSLWDKICAGAGFVFGTPSILNPAPLHKLLDKTFQNLSLEDAASISGKQMIISSLDLNSQREEFYTTFTEGNSLLLSDVLKRTSAIPGVFKSILGETEDTTQQHWYVDGGVGANNPFISVNKYNETFTAAGIKKVIVIYCYPDIPVDTASLSYSPADTKEYKSFRDVLLRTVGASLAAQEQMTELIIEDKVSHSDWDVLALYPEKVPCDSLDFTKTEVLQQGYDYAVAGKGWSYKDKASINILDFLKRK